MFLLSGCIPPKKTQINDFKETMDNRIGRESSIVTSSSSEFYKKEKISTKIIRYYFKMNKQGYMGGKECVIYEDVDTSTNKIIKWGYVSLPDKCRKGLNWLVF